MNYIENIYFCLAVPLFLAIHCMRREGRRALVFLLAGMTVSLFSAYVNSYLVSVLNLDVATASYQVSPAVEEIMKSMPLVFFLLVFEPVKKIAIDGTLMVSVGFATFENVCFLSNYGTSNLFDVLIRGFGAGAMHVMCGMVVAVSISFLWDRAWLRIMGGVALLCSVISFHGLFNILVSQTGILFWIAVLLPIIVVLLYISVLRRWLKLM